MGVGGKLVDSLLHNANMRYGLRHTSRRFANQAVDFDLPWFQPRAFLEASDQPAFPFFSFDVIYSRSLTKTVERAARYQAPPADSVTLSASIERLPPNGSHWTSAELLASWNSSPDLQSRDFAI